MCHSHCPWVWNCGKLSSLNIGTPILMQFVVGANNHRQFLLFVSTLVIDIVLFDYLVYECMFSIIIFLKSLN
jgi:hypothetical protein